MRPVAVVLVDIASTSHRVRFETTSCHVKRLVLWLLLEHTIRTTLGKLSFHAFVFVWLTGEELLMSGSLHYLVSNIEALSNDVVAIWVLLPSVVELLSS